MGIPFTEVDFVYFEGEANNRGLKEETSRISNVKTLWKGNLTQKYKDSRFFDDGVDAEIQTIPPRKDLTLPTPRTTMIERTVNGETERYKVLNVMEKIITQVGIHTLGIASTTKVSP